MLLLGDSLEKLKELEDNSIDAIVTDPPYGLSFMGKKWDYDVPSVELWRETFRVLKYGGHLLSFGGTRTYHRMVVNIEDAGFEIRDQIQWLYGSGFPKSHDISKAIDKQKGTVKLEPTGETCPDIRANNYSNSEGKERLEIMKSVPQSEDAIKWQGWGTALKPANEPIVLARKPLEKGLTIAENVLKYGVGGLNIDVTRIGFSQKENIDFSKVQDGNIYGAHGTYGKATQKETTPLFKQSGRWPANLILDEIAAEMLGEPSRFFYVAKASKSERNRGLEGMPEKESGVKNDSGRGFSEGDPYKKVLNQNFHPTVKPVKLMEYLVKLVTPKDGTVLDPFMGSGTTGVACKKLGFEFVGIELSEEYFNIAKERIKNV